MCCFGVQGPLLEPPGSEGINGSVRVSIHTLSLGGQSGYSHIIIRLSIGDDNEVLPAGARARFKEISHGEVDGVTSGRASAHVRDVLQSSQRVVFRGVVVETELHPLVVGELDGADARSDVGDIEAACDVSQKVQH